VYLSWHGPCLWNADIGINNGTALGVPVMNVTRTTTKREQLGGGSSGGANREEQEDDSNDSDSDATCDSDVTLTAMEGLGIKDNSVVRIVSNSKDGGSERDAMEEDDEGVILGGTTSLAAFEKVRAYGKSILRRGGRGRWLPPSAVRFNFTSSASI